MHPFHSNLNKLVYSAFLKPIRETLINSPDPRDNIASSLE
jgi:hypothetical protein